MVAAPATLITRIHNDPLDHPAPLTSCNNADSTESSLIASYSTVILNWGRSNGFLPIPRRNSVLEHFWQQRRIAKNGSKHEDAGAVVI